MTAAEVLTELEALGNPGTRKTLLRHGAREPLFGVKIGDMQKLRKRIKTDHQLALDLWDSGNYDAMYFAGLIADDARMTKAQLKKMGPRGFRWRAVRIRSAVGRGGKPARAGARPGMDRS